MPILTETRGPGGIPLVTLADDATETSVVVAPARGALVTSLRVRGRELLYLDESTLIDPTKNVRGGIPVLFPIAGKLANDHWEHAGKTGEMKQHGFGRLLPWTVSARGEADPSKVTLELASSDVTRAQYPWDFHAELTLTVRPRGLRYDVRVTNTGAGAAMPVSLGFHPYFRVADKGQTRVDTGATRAFDAVQKKERPLDGIDLTLPEVDLRLVDHGRTSSALQLADGARIDLRASADFTEWVVWTLAGKDFVCVEPWTAPGNALNTKERLVEIERGKTREFWVEVGLGG